MMLPLSYGLEVIHFLEHPKQDHHHHHHRNHHHHHHHHHSKPPGVGNLRLGREEVAGRGLSPLSPNAAMNGGEGRRPLELVFRGIRMSCKQKLILKDVSGMVRPGEVLAVMGPSGSGKTTLLNALSGRHKLDAGVITLNGEAINKELRRKICYVLQQDIFLPNLTLRQTLMFCALLRLPEYMSYKEKMDYVEHLADVLDLRHCLDSRIGDNMKRGLSGGEKKRANIACELLTNPTLLLIDEPTTGLDSSSAYSVIQTLKHYAQTEGKTIVVTVHQPSSQIFHMFDGLLLLIDGQEANLQLLNAAFFSGYRDGLYSGTAELWYWAKLVCHSFLANVGEPYIKVAYFGSEENVIDFFTNIGFPITPNYNPADFIMEHLRKDPEIKGKILSAAQELQRGPDYPEELKKSICQGTSTGAPLDMPTSSGEIRSIQCPHCQMKMWPKLNYRIDTHKNLPKANTEGYRSWDLAKETMINMSQPVELRAMLDTTKKLPTVYSHIENREDEDSGRSSWSYDGSSSSSNSREDLKHDPKWPTSFLTQLRVLSQRNFLEARRRMLSKLNWAQTFGLGIVSGLMWFQTERKESTLFDIKGWMFFSSTYWMLFALFEALVSFPPEREVINKERASGAYRLSAYYLAKMIGELPFVITLPSVFHAISYPMLGFQGYYTFLCHWGLLLLSTIVAQSVGLFVGASCIDLQMSVTISSLYSLSTMLFGGFYSTTVRSWLSWLKYLSMVHYTFQSMQTVEFTGGMPVRCSEQNSIFKACKSGNVSFIPPIEILSQSEEHLPLWANIIVLLLFLFAFRLLGYLALRYFRTPK